MAARRVQLFLFSPSTTIRANCARVLVGLWFAVMGLAATPPALANTQQWAYAGTTYPTKEQAIAAMHAARPQNAVLTQEKLVQLTATEAEYAYSAPPQSPSYGTVVYHAYCPGWSNPCTYNSELDAAVALAQGPFSPECGPGNAQPTGPWTPLQGPPTIETYRLYQAHASGYNQSPPACTGIETLNTDIETSQSVTCPQYYSLMNTSPPSCVDSDSAAITGVPIPCATSPAPGNSAVVGDPCDASTGDNTQSETDYSGPVLKFVRSYHSGTLESFHRLGIGWTHNFAGQLVLSGSTPQGLIRPDGHHDPLGQVIGHTIEFVSESGAGIHVQSSGANWIAYLTDGSQEVYNSNGVLIEMVNSAGQTTALNYNTDGTLASVVDAFGHSLQFTYTNGLISQVADPAGGTIAYAYDANVNLRSVTYQDGTTRTYAYEAATMGSHLTGITDESGGRYSTYAYDSNGRATSSQLAGGAEAVSIVYGVNAATVTDGIGGTTVFNFTNTGWAPRVSGVVRNGLTRSYVVNAPNVDVQQRTTQMTDENGSVTTYAYDNDHLTSTTQGSGSPVARTISYTYLAANTALPTLITEPLRKTSYAYYTGTNLVQTKTVTDLATGAGRSWNYTYDSYGRVLTADGPRTDVSDITTYTYYTCSTGAQCGQVATITDAAGNVTTYNTYNAHGQPLTITGPNGVVTTLAYDLRQRLTSRQVGTETTTFSYYPTGLLKQVALPDASLMLYTYDAAHRLTQVSDSLGNKIVYTLDAMGNRTAEGAYDPSGTLHRTHTRVFNVLNQLYQDVNAAGTAAVTTTFGYDGSGNQTSISAPMTRNTANVYDALNRLKQITDPSSGVTHFVYDANDHLTSVTDPRSLTTSYTYSGFGDLKTQVSPDTGTTTNTYDSGGNLATSTDARGATASYSYDALNRVTSVAYSQGGTTDQTISFGYDAGTNGKGHLTSASDANHSLGWTYDALGRVLTKTQTVGTVTKSVGYAYTSGDLTTLTTPSGQTVTYGYNGNHQINSITVNGTTVLNAVTYEPLGPVNGWTWGNGSSSSRTYDTDQKITQIADAGTKSLTYDNAFRITGISDTSAGASNWTYAYDALDRITSGGNGTLSRGWTYDADGNRLTETGSSPSTYSVSTASNQINSITGSLARTYDYDAAGHTTGYATVTAGYNDAGRLQTVTNGSVTETLLYNALGQRIQTSGGPAGTVLYWYDEAGHLLGEYDGSGTLIEETVWLGDTPVATLRPNGTGVDIFYVHTDQLNTPRQVTRPSDNAQMWTWFSDPFGTDAASENPSGAGTFKYNLRLPGQIFDGQAGLHANYFRDYEPATGRYAESDPVGLRGGVNTYAYVGNKPLRKSDPLGLFTSDQHAAITYNLLVEEPKLIPCITEILTGVVGLDFVAGSQTIPYAYLHAMAQPGQSAAQAAEKSNQFVFDQINKCDCKALGYALHTVQDSAAWGHQYKTYDGSVSLLHLFTDYDPSSDRITEATVKSKNVISEYKSHCLSCSK